MWWLVCIRAGRTQTEQAALTADRQLSDLWLFGTRWQQQQQCWNSWYLACSDDTKLKKKKTHKTLTYSHLFEFLGLAPKLELTHIIFPGFCVISLPVGMCFFKEIFPVCVKCGFIRYWHKQTTRGSSSPVTPSYGLKYILSIKNNNSLDLYLDSDGMSFFTCLEWFVLQEGAHDTVSAGTDCQ